MKYILMMHGTKAAFDDFAKWSKEDLLANMTFMRNFSEELHEAGVFVSTEGLGWPDQAKLVRARSDGAPITDGIFPESKEFLAGYWIIDVESPEEAYKYAAKASTAPGPGGIAGSWPIEVRQVMSSAEDIEPIGRVIKGD